MSQNAIALPTTGTVSGLQMTQDMNAALDTLNTLSSGASAPSSPEAGQLWHDTTNNILKIRSLDNTTWIPAMNLSESAYAAAPVYPAQITGSVNRLINGGMTIDQVNESASYSIPLNNTVQYLTDQWAAQCISGSAAGVTGQQVTDAPPGFSNSLKITVGTGASSVGTTDLLYVYQPIEANNMNDLNYGSANAMSLSLSFWVKSSVTGTFAVALGNSSGGNRQLVGKFTVNATGTWQLVQFQNIPGDQSGTWGAGSASSLKVYVVLASGSNYQTATLGSWQGGFYLASNTQSNAVLTTSGATFQFTGAMLNPGPFCLPFEKRSITQELQACERYYEKSFPQGIAVAQNAGTSGAFAYIPASSSFGCSVFFRTPKRAAATLITYNPSASNANWRDPNNSADRSFIGGSPSDKQFQCYGSGGATNSSTLIHYSASARM